MAVETKSSQEASPDTAQPRVGWRIKLGFTIFVASIVWPVLVPILPLLGVSSKSVATFTGVMLMAAEVGLLAAAAIAGKDGFAYIKQRIFGVLKSYGPPQAVSAMRYRIGLVMFMLPLLFAFLAPYLDRYIPALDTNPMVPAVAGDLLLLVALFVLGGDFWDKLRSLFLHNAVAMFPGKPAN
jgi:hypothetical protein